MNSFKKGGSVRILLVGAGSYGYLYLQTILSEFRDESVSVIGVIEPVPERAVHYDRYKQARIPFFKSIDAFYREGNQADLAIIISPTHLHIPHSIAALKNGSHVLCEEPIGSTIQDVNRLIKVRNKTERWVMIGYQWSYSEGIQLLKSDIQKGIFGRPVRFKALYFRPMEHHYYNETGWRGKLRSDDGSWILDGPSNNAMAYILHNLLYLLGDQTDRSAEPEELLAECYHAYPIESYDTIASKIITPDKTELLFYTSHVTETGKGPIFKLEFENAVVSFGEYTDCVTARFNNGNVMNYESPEDDHPFRKLYHAIRAVEGQPEILCGPEASLPHTLCVNGIHESIRESIPFPKKLYKKNKKRVWVQGLDNLLYGCYLKNQLPHERKTRWTKSGIWINLSGYHFFPGGERGRRQEAVSRRQ